MQQKQILTQKEQLALQTNAVQVVFSHLVELPLQDMERKVADELTTNEALEEMGREERTEDNVGEEVNGEGAENDLGEFGDRELPEMDDRIADYASADDVPQYLLKQNNGGEERVIQIGAQNSVYDEIYRQIGEHDLTEEEREVLEYLIGSLDDNGYLSKDDQLLTDEMEIYHNIYTSTKVVARMRQLLQSFEPRGIGANDLQDCMRIQLEAPELHAAAKEVALEIVNRCFKDFTLKHWEAICQRLHISEDELEEAKQVLVHLNPRPGGGYNDLLEVSAPTIVPDFYVKVDEEGAVEVGLNRGEVPELKVSRSFKNIINEFGGRSGQLTRKQNDELVYARQKVNAAQLFIDLVKRRQDTLLGVMRTIVDLQHSFFVNEDDEMQLVPLTLKDVADRIEMDVSTVSRVTASKYVQTFYGVYPLKFFFSSAFMSEDGEEMSSRQAKIVLQRIIDAEDKAHPLSDQSLSERMKEEGQPISRRTVVKYREQLGIPSSRMRKE